ncbi:Conserved_hypothetical protein [Hexamita inflata]|uniref:Uncharacterized protein n=1 Tax=Hexamita inflata TaxID=28002 RepID=A0AA86R4P8_9EUKA|nr:Conserved hypothetical protein [Hexamita inflata]
MKLKLHHEKLKVVTNQQQAQLKDQQQKHINTIMYIQKQVRNVSAANNVIADMCVRAKDIICVQSVIKRILVNKMTQEGTHTFIKNEQSDLKYEQYVLIYIEHKNSNLPIKWLKSFSRILLIICEVEILTSLTLFRFNKINNIKQTSQLNQSSTAYLLKQLFNQACELNQDFLYDILITKAAYPEYNNQVIQVERFQLMKHIPRSSHVKVISDQFYGLTGRVIDLVEENDKIYLELRADVVEEYIDRSYKITGDDVIISSDTCISLDEVIADEKLFQKNQLVKLNSGMDGVVTFLLYKSARIITTENRIVNQALSELQPVFNKKRIPIVQDGSNPPQSVSLSSTIRIKDSQTRGKVVQISSQQTGSCLFIQISSGDDVGISAVLAKNVICVEGGPIISKNKRSQAQMLQGANIRLTDPNYFGREGLFLRQVGEESKLIEVQLAEKKVTVPIRCVTIIGETQVAEKLVEETKVRESQFGATQYKQQQYEDWEEEGMNQQQKFTQQTQDMNYKTQGNDEDDEEGYGGF